MAWSKVMAAVLALAAVSAASGADYMRNKHEVESLLTGRVLNGIYLRTQSSYTLEFRADGSLLNQAGAEGRWWVNDEGQYCREWLSGQLAGNKACVDLAREGDKIAIYSGDKKVAEGNLAPLP